MKVLEDVDKFLEKPYTRPKTGFRIEQEEHFKRNTHKLKSDINGVKGEVCNILRDQPKGFKDVRELDRWLK